MRPKALCHIDDIPEGDSKGLQWQGKALVAVRQQGQLFIYENSCPHLGVPLEWRPDQFLNTDSSLIQCSTHGALFTIDAGECISGPCLGQSLVRWDYQLDDGWVLPNAANAS